MNKEHKEQRRQAPWSSYVRRLLLIVTVLMAANAGLADTASADAYWWNGDRVEESWYSTHPTSYYYTKLTVDTPYCGSVCTRWLDSTSSGLISSSAEIKHWPSGGSATSWLSCKWDTAGSGSITELECWRRT
jgi:hypothetical protein